MRSYAKIGLCLLVWSWAFCTGSAKADIVADVLGCKDDPCVIAYNPGGAIKVFEAAAKAIAKGARTRVVVDGWCISACTIALDKVRDRVCVTPRAKLGFHRGTEYKLKYLNTDRSSYQTVTNLFDISYSPDINRWIHGRGGLPKDGSLITMGAGTAQTIWPICSTALLPQPRPQLQFAKKIPQKKSLSAATFNAHGLY